MFRIDTTTAVGSLPAPTTPGTPGYFTDGNPTTGSPATVVSNDWLNMIQEELLAIIVAGGETESKTTYNQVLTAINTLISGAITPGRTRLSGNTNYYVSPSGNDSTGTGASGNPWLTIQHAVSYVSNNIDFAGFSVTINVASGTYASFIMSTPVTGTGILIIEGASASTCIINGSSGNAVVVTNGAVLNLGGFTIEAAGGGGIGLNVNNQGNVTINSPVIFGAAGNYQIFVTNGGFLYFEANYTINGGAIYHTLVNNTGSCVVQTGTTVTLTGTPNFSLAFIDCDTTGVWAGSAINWSGAATGQRYYVSANGVIDTNGGGANYLPGNSAGNTTTGGQYI